MERAGGRWRRGRAHGAVAALGLTVLAGDARGDRREASVHVHAVGGAAALGHDAAQTSGAGALGGLGVRASYATHNGFQYDVQLALLYAQARFDAGVFRLGGATPTTAPFGLASGAARLDGGVTLRMGVRWIPTVRVAAGLQVVRRGSPVVTVDGVAFRGDDTAPPSLAANLIGAVTAGLDYRVDRRLIVGAALGAVAAVPGLGDDWREATLTVHVARYWYPRW